MGRPSQSFFTFVTGMPAFAIKLMNKIGVAYSSRIILKAEAIVAAVYSESMARVRKYPAISYLVVSIFPMLPGAGIYYTSNYLVQGNMQAFSEKGLTTVGIAGVLAVGILLVSTLVRLWTVWKQRKHT